jgi:hypothetical protein
MHYNNTYSLNRFIHPIKDNIFESIYNKSQRCKISFWTRLKTLLKLFIFRSQFLSKIYCVDKHMLKCSNKGNTLFTKTNQEFLSLN